MNEDKQYCSFCKNFTFRYVRYKNKIHRGNKFLCYSCIDIASALKQKAILVESQLELGLQTDE
jgi:hypothetical protein